jgi:hypothetical protein
MSADERNKAKDAYNLCALIGHRRDQAVILGLDNGSLGPTHLTSQDLRNIRREWSSCIACMEGKMKAPSEKTSNTEPARSIGEHLYGDMLFLSTISLGGNRLWSMRRVAS